MMTCHSEVCFVPAEGPHLALSYDLTEKWAATIIHSLIIWSKSAYIGYNSFEVLSLLPSIPLPILLHLIQFQLILLF